MVVPSHTVPIPGKAGYKVCGIYPFNPKLYNAVPLFLVSKQTAQLGTTLIHLFRYLLQSLFQRLTPEHNDNVDPPDDLSHEILNATSVVDKPAVVVQQVDELAVVVEPVDDTMDVITDPEAVLSLFNGGDFIEQGEIYTDRLEPVVPKTTANWNQEV